MSKFIDKEYKLLSRLYDTDYKAFGGSQYEASVFVTDKFAAFAHYASAVLLSQSRLPVLHSCVNGQELRQGVHNIEQNLRAARENAVSAINTLNSMFLSLGMEKFADIDTDDEMQVADFMSDYINELFDSRTGRPSGCQIRQSFTTDNHLCIDLSITVR